MKLFGWKSAGRDDSRPVLSRVGAARVSGDWPVSYEAQVRESYFGNAIAQRAVRLVADGLSVLLRGRRGTEAAIALHAVGDRFVLIEQDAVIAIDLPLSSAGTVVKVIASGIGDVAGPAMIDVSVPGASVSPPAPVHLTATDLPGGDVLIRWVRRSRAGWRWIDGADAPLGEENEAYRVTMVPLAGPLRIIELAVAELTVAAADRTGGPLTLQVRQAGSYGESLPAEIVLPAL